MTFDVGCLCLKPEHKKTCFPLKAISCFSLSVTSEVFIILDSIQNWIKFRKKYHLPFKTTLKTCFYISFQPPKIPKKQTTTPKKAVFLVASSRLVAPRRSRRHRSTGVTRFAPWPPQPPSKGRSNARRKHRRRRGRATRRSWRLMTVTRCASFCLDFNGLQKLAT